MRLARRGYAAHVQARVVLQHRAYAREHGAGAGAPGMAVGARFGRRDPLALAIGQRRRAVERGRGFHAHPGRAAHHAAEEADVEFARFGGARSDLNLDTSSAQAFKALTRHQRIGVGDRRHDATDARGDQRVAARAGAAVVGAGFQGDIGRGACDRTTSGCCIAEGHHLGVRAADRLRVAGAEHGALRVCQNAADRRVGRCQQCAMSGQLKALFHTRCHFLIKARTRNIDFNSLIAFDVLSDRLAAQIDRLADRGGCCFVRRYDP